MGFKPGHNFGGNRKGIPNKKTALLRELTQAKAEELLEKASTTIDAVKDPFLRAQLWLKFLELILPKPETKEDDSKNPILVYDRYATMSPETLKELVKKDLAADEKETEKEKQKEG